MAAGLRLRAAVHRLMLEKRSGGQVSGDRNQQSDTSASLADDTHERVGIQDINTLIGKKHQQICVAGALTTTPVSITVRNSLVTEHRLQLFGRHPSSFRLGANVIHDLLQVSRAARGKFAQTQPE